MRNLTILGPGLWHRFEFILAPAAVDLLSFDIPLALQVMNVSW